MEYKKYKLGEFIDTISDTTPINKDKVILVNTSDVENGYVLNHNHVENKNLKGQFKKRFRRGDILYSEIRPKNKRFAYIDFEAEDYIASTKLMVLRNKGNIDNEFLFQLLKSDKIVNRLQMLAESRSGTFPQITFNELSNVDVYIPEVKIQKKISEFLQKIDKKIELNNQINDNLYELGDALYNEYYSKYENELPNGYKYLNLNEVSVNFDSKRKPMSSREREQHKGTYPYYGATSIIDYVDDYIFDDTYLLMGEDGTVKTSEGYPVLQYIWGKNWINNHAHVLQGTIISTEYLMFALRKKNIEALITGAVQPKINQVNMNKIKIIIGTDKVNKKFEEKTKIIVTKIKANTIENETLTQLRDTLLPKLMNGEIDLDKIEI